MSTTYPFEHPETTEDTEHPSAPGTRPPSEFPDEGAGIYRDVDAEDYHALEGRASSSVLRELITKTPAHAKAKMEDQVEPTSAMRLGTLLHEAILEPALFDENYDVPTDCATITGSGDRCSYSGKYSYWTDLNIDGKPAGEEYELRWYCGTHDPPDDSELHEEADVEKVSASKMEKIEGMRRRLQEHEAARQLLFSLPGHAELTILFEHPTGEVPSKARIDRVVKHPTLGTVALDYKTTSSADPAPHEWGRSAAYGRYDVQAAFYLDALEAVGLECDYFLWVAQETSPPYAPSVVLLDNSDQMRIARSDLQEALASYRECTRSGEWPGYSEGVVSLRMPAWYYED